MRLGSVLVSSCRSAARLAYGRPRSGIPKKQVVESDTSAVVTTVYDQGASWDRAIHELKRDAVRKSRSAIDIEHPIAIREPPRPPEPAVAFSIDVGPEPYLELVHVFRY